MVYRTVDEDGDMMPIRANSDMLSGSEAVAAAVNSRLRLLTGEWWEDEDLGFAVPDILFNGLRREQGQDLLAGYITAYIEETEGVRAVTSVHTEVSGRAMHYTCTLVTDFGEIEEEVGADVLLRTVFG